MITDKQVWDRLRGVMHPEIKNNLVDLGMVGDVVVSDQKVSLTLALPFKTIPIKDDLVRLVRQAIAQLDGSLEVTINLTEMSQQERANFMEMAEGGPKPAQAMNKVNRVIAVLSGKGGVGKSSVAALLAVTLARQGKAVGVLDADITGPSIPRMFGLHNPPPMGPLGILPAQTPLGIKVMSINLLLPSEDEAVIWRGPLISGAIKQFWEEVVWGNLDYLIDLAGMVVRKAARMAQHMSAPILGLVENMGYIKCPRCGERIEVFGPSQAMNTCLRLGLPLLGQLPLDPELARRCDAGEIEEYKAEMFEPIADQVARRLPVPERG